MTGGDKYRTRAVLEAALRLGLYYIGRNHDIQVALGVDMGVDGTSSPPVVTEEEGAGIDLLEFV